MCKFRYCSLFCEQRKGSVSAARRRCRPDLAHRHLDVLHDVLEGRPQAERRVVEPEMLQWEERRKGEVQKCRRPGVSWHAPCERPNLPRSGSQSVGGGGGDGRGTFPACLCRSHARGTGQGSDLEEVVPVEVDDGYLGALHLGPLGHADGFLVGLGQAELARVLRVAAQQVDAPHGHVREPAHRRNRP